MISTLSSLRLLLRGARASALMFLLCSAANVSLAQSIDIKSPSPVRTNEVVGTITARDLGDSRSTNHFYAFTGTPGDVSITVTSNNLNGDVDLFTAGSLRPLMKFTLYAENSSPATRSIFLRRREDLILRVEARSPNDDEGTYQIRLGGSFEPIAGDVPLAEANSPTSETAPTVASLSKGSRRVSSVGPGSQNRRRRLKKKLRLRPLRNPHPKIWRYQQRLRNPPLQPRCQRLHRRPEGAGDACHQSAEGQRRSPPRKTEQSDAETTSGEKAAEVPNADSPAPATRRTGRRGTINRPTEEQIPGSGTTVWTAAGNSNA